MSNKTLNALIILLLLMLAYSINNRQSNITEVHQTVVVTQVEMDILNRLNAPQESIRIIIAWVKAEGADLNCNNPLNTSLDAPGATTINSHGVKCYPDYTTGLEATITTLLATEYTPIVTAIQQADETAFIVALGNSRWGTDANLVKQILEENTVYMAASGNKHHVTIPINVTANFYSKGDVWCFQNAECMHTGTDYTCPRGCAVYTPFDCHFLSVGTYGPGPMMGDYFMCTLLDGAEYYSGHLDKVVSFAPGTLVPAGTQIGVTNEYDHTHVQLRINNQLADFEAYWEAR